MSLDYDLTQIDKAVRAEHYPATSDGYQNPITVGLVWMTMSVGIGTITDATAIEFYARAKMIERLYGPTVHQADGTEGFTLDDVMRHKGLRTNVFPQESRTSFLKRHCLGMLDDTVRRTKRTVAERERNNGHDEACRARAVGIACQNIDDQPESERDGIDAVTLGDSYLVDGITACRCGKPVDHEADGNFIAVGRVAIRSS